MNLTDFGIQTLKDRYLLNGESIEQMFWRVATAFADDEYHATRLHKYMTNFWFMPSTPILANAGTNRGLPISCFLNEVPDSLSGIVDTWNENIHLSANGGGIASYWGNVRSVGESINNKGETSGIMPFVHVMDSLSLAISQGGLRRGSAAVYLNIDHPEIEEFLELRKASGDFNRKGLNLNHGICITDDFMKAVRVGDEFSLVSPVTNEHIKHVDARSLWQKILETRIQTGEPYLVFIDNVNNSLPGKQKEKDLWIKTSNLCSEIFLPTDERRTAVCCLASLNLETWDEWRDQVYKMTEDVMRMLDNVLSYYSDHTKSKKARNSVENNRAVGLGVMGFHSFLQSRNIPFEHPMASVWNHRFFISVRDAAHSASSLLADERGEPLDSLHSGHRFSYKMAVAPTASISIICGGTSPSIEPITANAYTHKTLSGSFFVKNKYLQKILENSFEMGSIESIEDEWTSIIGNEGSVQHLTYLTPLEKEVFKTAFEIDQEVIVNLAADRAKYIDQGQSINLFLPANVSKKKLHDLHFKAWENGVKSLYYCRSKSMTKAEFVGDTECLIVCQ